MSSEVARGVAALDIEAVRRTYLAQNEFFYIERWLPPPAVDSRLADVARVRPAIHGNYVPRHKKGGSVSAYTLAREAPAMVALSHAPTFIDVLSAVAGLRLRPCPDSDPHACALYFYTEPGDHIGFHYDTSYYKRSRFTVLVGLIERSSRLVCQPFKSDPAREPREISLATEPGTLVFVNGDRLWHAVTPLGEGEERVTLTLE